MFNIISADRSQVGGYQSTDTFLRQKIQRERDSERETARERQREREREGEEDRKKGR